MPIVADPHRICSLLKSKPTIAVVGLSNRPWRDSHIVARYLIDHGFTVYPVNPTISSVFDLESFPTLESIPHPVSLVNIFRRRDQCASLVKSASAIGSVAVWFQFSTSTDEGIAAAVNAGLDVIVEKCIMVEHTRCI